MSKKQTEKKIIYHKIKVVTGHLKYYKMFQIKKVKKKLLTEKRMIDQNL